jgi:Leucine-rich repeat (LRR) protein
LSGRIPAEIGQLSLLKTLFIDINSLSGPLPDEMGLMSSLQLLNLADNSLTGTIPSTFSALRNLRQVRLSFNKFVDGADNICKGNSTNVPVFELDCLQQVLPAIAPELGKDLSTEESAYRFFTCSFCELSVPFPTSLFMLHNLLFPRN